MSGVSVSDSSGPSRLERRARKLLRAYPPGYREHRGEEILGTLLEAACPGRSWPSARETASIVGSGLCARRNANQRQGVAASLRQAAVLGVTLYLVGLMSSQFAGYLDSVVWVPGMVPMGWMKILPFAALAPLAAAWRGRRRPAAVTAVIAGAACAFIPVRLMVSGDGTPTYGFHDGLRLAVLEKGLTVPLLALAALALVTRSAEQPPRSWLWLPSLGVAMPAALSICLWATPARHALNLLNGWVTPWPYFSPPLAMMVVACACWLVTDFRPLAGLAIGLALAHAFNDLAYQPTLQELTGTVAPLAVAIALAWMLRRRTRNSPPAAS